MKKVLLPLVFVFTAYCCHSQNLSQVSMSGGSSFKAFSFETDQKVIIRISQEGKILEWGTPMEEGRWGYYPGKLIPYIGRVDYYGNDVDSAFRGKVKSIGSCYITYYGSNQQAAQKGKVKSLGIAQFDYYLDYDNEAFRGRLKSAGFLSITWYASYDNESYRGKLKSIGTTSLTWYSVFDDKLNAGKIKSIGSVNYAWYSQYDSKDFRGSLKSGAASSLVNGVVYNIYQ